jgi:polyphosphate glucokinase
MKSKAKARSPLKRVEPASGAKTLAIDIGGTGLKAAVLDSEGEMLTERVRVATPHPCPPELMVKMLAELVAPAASC